MAGFLRLSGAFRGPSEGLFGVGGPACDRIPGQAPQNWYDRGMIPDSGLYHLWLIVLEKPFQKLGIICRNIVFVETKRPFGFS